MRIVDVRPEAFWNLLEETLEKKSVKFTIDYARRQEDLPAKLREWKDKYENSSDAEKKLAVILESLMTYAVFQRAILPPPLFENTVQGLFDLLASSLSLYGLIGGKRPVTLDFLKLDEKTKGVGEPKNE